MTETTKATTHSTPGNAGDDSVEPIEKFRKLMLEFDDAMLVSNDTEGLLHARPMQIAARHQDQLDDLWFVTAVDSGKIEEIHRNPRVAVVLSDGKRFLSVSGRGQVVVDRAKITSMWQERWKLWFPDGPNSENVALIQVQPIRAEYWDRSLPNGIRFAFEAAKAWFKDEAIDVPEGPEHHAKVGLA
jgi:general stress protein 26